MTMHLSLSLLSRLSRLSPAGVLLLVLETGSQIGYPTARDYFSTVQ